MPFGLALWAAQILDHCERNAARRQHQYTCPGTNFEWNPEAKAEVPGPDPQLTFCNSMMTTGAGGTVCECCEYLRETARNGPKQLKTCIA